MNMALMTAAAICFVVHGLVGSVDGAYFHLQKYKLHTRAESLFEHQLHTCRAGFLCLTALLLFTLNSGGWLLWLAVLILVADLIALVWDVWIERQSRATLGGLTSPEYLIHVLASILHATSITLALASKPVTAWSVGSELLIAPEFPLLMVLCGAGITGVTALSTLQHLWYWRPQYRNTEEAA